MSNYKKVILYIPKEYKNLNLIRSTLTYPFWGIPERKNYSFEDIVFHKYGFSKDYYDVSEDEEDADYVFLPYQFWSVKNKKPELINAFIALSKELKIPLLIDAIGDKMDKINIPNSVVLRYAQYRRNFSDNDVIVPVYTEDLLESYCSNKIKILEKETSLKIGFVGWAHLSFPRYWRTYVKEIPIFITSLFFKKHQIYRKGIFLRSKIIRKLKLSKQIKTNFIERSFFSGNKKTLEKDPEMVRKEFIENILDSQYSLCVKGDANQSTRFFEVLSLGRIPIFVDTECVLPLEEEINYKDFCLFVDYRDINKVDKIIEDFHINISGEKFKDMQIRAREIYREHLRIDAYTKYLMSILNSKLKNKKE